MPLSMQHWNGKQMVVIDCETTGLDPHWNEIIQLAILPVDSNINIRKDVHPFYIEMKVEWPERVEPKAMAVNKLKFADIQNRGTDPDKAKDMLEDWIDKLDLPYQKFGANRCRLIPLGHNYAFDRSFLQEWLSVEQYSKWFDGQFCDTQYAASYMNDRAAMHGEKVPFSKINLSYLCSTLKLPHERAHDALQDCVATARVYQQMLLRGLLG